MTWNDDSWAKERNEIVELRQYASRFDLLSKEEEIEFTNEYWDLKTSIIPLANTLILKYHSVAPNELWSFILYYLVQRKNWVGEEIVKRNVRLVLKICQSQTYVGRGLPIFDLFMAGYDGLRYGCLTKYNPKMGFRVSTYVTSWIHQRIGRAIRKTASAIKVAGHKEDLMSKIRMVVREYVASNNGSKPDADAISVLLKKKYNKDVDPEEIAELGRFNWSILSLDEESTEEESQGLTMSDFLQAPEQYEPEVAFEFQEMKNKIDNLISTLDDKERIVLSYSYGLIDSVERKPKAISKLMSIPEREVKDILKSAMDKLSGQVKGSSYFNEE